MTKQKRCGENRQQTSSCSCRDRKMARQLLVAMTVVAVVALLSTLPKAGASPSCLDENGRPVDWWCVPTAYNPPPPPTRCGGLVQFLYIYCYGCQDHGEGAHLVHELRSQRCKRYPLLTLASSTGKEALISRFLFLSTWAWVWCVLCCRVRIHLRGQAEPHAEAHRQGTSQHSETILC